MDEHSSETVLASTRMFWYVYIEWPNAPGEEQAMDLVTSKYLRPDLKVIEKEINNFKDQHFSKLLKSPQVFTSQILTSFKDFISVSGNLIEELQQRQALPEEVPVVGKRVDDQPEHEVRGCARDQRHRLRG